MAKKDSWQQELKTLSSQRGHGKFAIFRPARADELDWAETALRDEPNLFARPRPQIAAAIRRRQFYVLEDANGEKVGCGAVWPIRRGVIWPDPGVPRVELGAIWLAAPWRGYGLERALGEIGIAEAIAYRQDAKIYTGAIFKNRISERNIRWLGFQDDQDARKIWSAQCGACIYRAEAIGCGLSCCVRPMSLPPEGVRDNLRSFIRNRSLLTFAKTTGEMLTVEMKIRSARNHKILNEWLSKNSNSANKK